MKSMNGIRRLIDVMTGRSACEFLAGAGGWL